MAIIMRFLFIIQLQLLILKVAAFVTPPIPSRRITSLQVIIDGDGNTSKNFTNMNGDEKAGKTSFDVEFARQQLENLLSNSMQESEVNGDNVDLENENKFSFSKILSDYEAGADFSVSSFPPPPPLSSIERDRRLVEIQLLMCLTEGDDAIPELWNHWYSERGGTAKERLEEIGGMFNDPKNWDECERNLIQLVEEYGIYFLEPINLLATLYFLQGKLELSYKLCQIVLTFKPYHVGALSGIVQVTLGMNDISASRKWARKRLPKSSMDLVLDEGGALDNQKEVVQKFHNPERVEWVEKAVTAAKALLIRAERRTKEFFFGKPDTHHEILNNDDSNSNVVDGFDYCDDDSDGSAWQ